MTRPREIGERQRKRCRGDGREFETWRERTSRILIVDGSQCWNLTLHQGREEREEEGRRFAAVPAMPDLRRKGSHARVFPV